MDEHRGRRPLTDADFEPVRGRRAAGLPPSPSSGRRLWRDLRLAGRRRPATAGALAVLLALSVLALLGPLASPYGYAEQLTDLVNLPPRMPALAWLGLADGSRVLYGRRADGLENPDLYPPGSVLGVLREYSSGGVALCDVKVDDYLLHGLTDSVNFWFGTDYLGRDLWSRTWRGTRLSLGIALAAVTISAVFGTFYGFLAGYYGGKVDMALMRLAEIVGAFPPAIVAILLVLLLGTGVRAIILALALRGWTSTARLARSQALTLRGREFVLAARTQGASGRRILVFHILPNGLGPLVTRAMAEVPGAIFSEAFLAFIGLGIQAPEPSLGVLISDAQQTMLAHPHQLLFPSVVISLLMLSFNLLGAGLREALDPRSRTGEGGR